jgi:hypothetical protein
MPKDSTTTPTNQNTVSNFEGCVAPRVRSTCQHLLTRKPEHPDHEKFHALSGFNEKEDLSLTPLNRLFLSDVSRPNSSAPCKNAALNRRVPIHLGGPVNR